MANYTEVINITVNDADVTNAVTNLNTLKTTINSLRNQTINIKGAESVKTMAREYKNLIKTMGNQPNLGSMNTMLREFNRMQKTMNKGTTIKINDSSVKSVISSVNKLTSEIQKLTSVSKGVNLNKLGNDGGQMKKLSSDVSTATRKLREYKSVASSMPSGNGHSANIYGWDADRSATYQASAATKKVSNHFNQMSEKMGVFGSNMAMVASLMGVKTTKEILVDVPAKAEVNKYFAGNMQGDATGFSIYDTLDKATDELPISMQNVVQPLYGFKSATGATAKQINDVVPDFANFGAQVINMTGSEERAETAMLKLAYAISTGDDKGRWEAVDQYGINEKAVRNAEENGKKIWNPTEEDQDVVGFMKAVTHVVGDARESMNNFNGMSQIVSKDFARAGKKVWENFTGPVLTGALRAYDAFDTGLGGIPSMLITLGSAGLSLGSTLTQMLGSMGLVISNFGEMSGALRNLRKNGGGLKNTLKKITIGSYRELMGHPQDASYYSSSSDPHLASIDSKLDGVIAEIRENNISDTMGESELPESVQKKRQRDIDRYRQYQRDNVIEKKKQRQRAMVQAYRESKNKPVPTNRRRGFNFSFKDKYSDFTNKIDAKRDSFYNKAMGFHPVTSVKRGVTGYLTKQKNNINNWGKGLRTTSFSMGSFKKTIGKSTNALKNLGSGALSLLTSWWMLIPAIMAIGAFSNYYSKAVKEDEDVRKANERLNKALDTAKNDFVTSLGNLFQSVGWSESGGEKGTYEALANAINTASRWVEHLPFIQKPDSYYTNERYKDNPQDDPNLGYKKRDIDRLRWLDWLSQPIGMLADALKEVGATLLETLGKVKEANELRSRDFTEEFNQQAASKIEEARNKDYLMEMRQNAEARRREADEHDEALNHVTEKQKEGVFHDNTAYGGNKTDTGSSWVKEGRDWWGNRTNATVQANNVELQGQNGGSTDNILGKILGGVLLGGLPNALQPVSAAPVDAEQQALQNAYGNQTQPANAVNMSQQVTQMYQSANQQVAMESANLANTISMSLSTAISTMDLTPVGTQMATSINQSIQTGLTTAPLDLTGFFSNITAQLSANNAQFNTSGNTAGAQYKTGFGTGIGGTSEIASGEASEVLSALDISSQAYALGAAAGESFQKGFKEKADINSPGKAARYARDESQYIIGFMQGAISPIYSTAQKMGSSLATGFTSTGELNALDISIPPVNQSTNSLSGIVNSTGEGNKTIHLTQNVNIEKVDSKERAKEIAEYTVKMVKWNNETAGRTEAEGAL